MPDIRAWSTTAADNDDADAAINWLEGQLPSTANNSARAMMAAVRGTFEGPDSKYNGLEWWDFGITPTRTGNTTFTLPTVDYTAAFVEGRRLRLTDSAALIATVVSSSFGAGATTVTVVVDGGTALSASLTKVFLSPQMPTSTSAPAIFDKDGYALTTGTSTAYVAAFTPPLTSLRNGATVRIRLHTACGATPTLAVDGLTAKTLVLPGNVAIAASDLPADAVLNLTYVLANDKWQIEGRSAVAASETIAGIAEIATQSEVNTGTDDARIVTPLKLAAFTSASVTDARNYIINPEGTVFQRAVPTTDNAYAWDRWRLLLGAANAATVSQLTSGLPTGAKNAMRLTVGSGNNNKFGIFQIIEGLDAFSLRGKTVTLQAQIKATAALADIRMAIVEWTGTENATKGDPISAWNSAATVPTYNAGWANRNTPANLSVTTSFAQYSVTAAVGASATNLAIFIWNEDTGSTQTTDILDITMIQFSAQAAASTYAPRPYALEFMLCRRFCQVIDCSVDGIQGPIGSGGAESGTTSFAFIPLSPPMRAVPTFSVSAASHFEVISSASTIACTAINTYVNRRTGLTVKPQVAAGLTAGNWVILEGTSSSGVFTITAEI